MPQTIGIERRKRSKKIDCDDLENDVMESEAEARSFLPCGFQQLNSESISPQRPSGNMKRFEMQCGNFKI